MVTSLALPHAGQVVGQEKEAEGEERTEERSGCLLRDGPNPVGHSCLLRNRYSSLLPNCYRIVVISVQPCRSLSLAARLRNGRQSTIRSNYVSVRNAFGESGHRNSLILLCFSRPPP